MLSSGQLNPAELVDREERQNGLLVIQGEVVSDPLNHLDAHKCMELNGIHPRVMRELAEELIKLLSIIHLSSVVANWGGPRQLEAGQCDAHLQEMLEGGSRELQVWQPDHSTQQGDGADHLKCDHTAQAGQPRHQTHPVKV